MRTSEEQFLALECLRLADGDVAVARAMLSFVKGEGEHAADCAVVRVEGHESEIRNIRSR